MLWRAQAILHCQICDFSGTRVGNMILVLSGMCVLVRGIATIPGSMFIGRLSTEKEDPFRLNDVLRGYPRCVFSPHTTSR
jgi:hypothetical protein